MSGPWYKNAIIYSLDVEVFRDSDGDGVGDLPGLVERLDYLAGLGINCIWLLPIYPTPNRDDGYDVADYYGIDPRLGSPGDFVVFMQEARQRGIHVIVELVVNHTSIDHPWFQAARRDPESKYRDYYIWIDKPPVEERRGGPVFPGEQSSNWAYDEEADAYYWHWFYSHQPDLNTGNAEVREEIKKIMAYWLTLGVSGFRMDAAPFLFKRKGIAGSHPEDPGAFLVELREFLSNQRSDAIFLAEADVNTDELSFFLGEGERMQLVFNFILNNNLFLALTRHDAEPLKRALESLPACPATSQWANFLRNHDELNLDRLEEWEKEEVFTVMAPDQDSRIYGRGIRRRLAPMLKGNRRHLEMVYSLLFAFPGVPVVRYGQEIGMGDELSLPGRLAVRTPMQWSDMKNGGFSAAPSERLVRPMVTDRKYDHTAVNVDSQRRDPASLLNFFLRLIRTRKECPEIGHGSFQVSDAGDGRVFAHTCVWRGAVTVAYHNLSPEACEVSFSFDPDDVPHITDVLTDAYYDPIIDPKGRFSINGYGYRWLRIAPLSRGFSGDGGAK